MRPTHHFFFAVFVVGFIILISGFMARAHAQALPQTSNQPIEISADRSLEWHKTENKLIARDNALVKQGDTAIEAQTITAVYSESSDSNTDKNNIGLKEVTAEKDVILTSRDNKAYGDTATYDVTNGLAVMRGSNLRMISPNQLLTAQDRFEYQVVQGRLLAIGNAKVKHTDEKGQTNTLQADSLIAMLADDQNGKRSLKTLEAKSNVVITTPTETLTGNYGVYNARNKTAVLEGNVEIRRGRNILQGARADVDLNTNQSRLSGSASPSSSSGGGRVRGVFYPESKNGS